MYTSPSFVPKSPQTAHGPTGKKEAEIVQEELEQKIYLLYIRQTNARDPASVKFLSVSEVVPATKPHLSQIFLNPMLVHTLTFSKFDQGTQAKFLPI